MTKLCYDYKYCYISTTITTTISALDELVRDQLNHIQPNIVAHIRLNCNHTIFIQNEYYFPIDIEFFVCFDK